MRLWSLHPRYLDRQGLTACWREALLGQAVVLDEARGYGRHPQLERFRAQPDALGAIAAYLHAVADEADARGYRFDRARVLRPPAPHPPIDVTDGQLAFEWAHLRMKLEARSPDVAVRWTGVDAPAPHPLFRIVPGPVAEWERAAVAP